MFLWKPTQKFQFWGVWSNLRSGKKSSTPFPKFPLATFHRPGPNPSVHFNNFGQCKLQYDSSSITWQHNALQYMCVFKKSTKRFIVALVKKATERPAISHKSLNHRDVIMQMCLSISWESSVMDSWYRCCGQCESTWCQLCLWCWYNTKSIRNPTCMDFLEWTT